MCSGWSWMLQRMVPWNYIALFFVAFSCELSTQGIGSWHPHKNRFKLRKDSFNLEGVQPWIPEWWSCRGQHQRGGEFCESCFLFDTCWAIHFHFVLKNRMFEKCLYEIGFTENKDIQELGYLNLADPRQRVLVSTEKVYWHKVEKRCCRGP